MKILVVGYSGSGKSTFTKRIAQLYKIDKLHIDKIFFAPNWVEREDKVVESEIHQFMKKENWIIDGSYRSLAKDRFRQCDQIFIFDFNRVKCFYGAIKRRIKYRNKQRDSVAEGCKERLNWSFIWWVLFQGRRKKSKQLLISHKEIYREKVIVFKNRKQTNNYLKSIGYKGSFKYE